MQQHGTKYLPADPPTTPPPNLPPPPTLGIGSKGQNLTFSEHGIKAYQIKGKHSMQQHSS